jgi:peptidoglycan/LPS O-acetylase OafA/YrhL
MFRTLQAGRGVAALMVLLYHLNGQVAALIGGSQALWLKVGWAGVDYFFVLSGFIILHAHRQDLGRPGRLLGYLRSRFARLYPVYWIVLVGVLGLMAVLPAAASAAQRAPLAVVSSFALVSMGAATVVGQAWTLYHEVVFYALFALAIVQPRAGVLALGAWMLACAARVPSSAPVWNEIDQPLMMLSSPLNLLFGLGMVARWALDHVRRGGLLTLLGAALFLLGLGLALMTGGDDQPALTHLMLGAGAALGVVGLCVLEREGRVRVPGFLFLLGGASYAIYLTHALVLSGVAKILARLHPSAWFAAPMMLVLALAVGIGFHLLIERPLLARLRPAKAVAGGDERRLARAPGA